MTITLNGTTGITTPAVSSTGASTFTGSLALPSGGLTVGTDQFAVDASGRVTMPYQPAFWATGSSNISAANPLILTEQILNRGNCFNTSTGYFTAPVAGVYRAAFDALSNTNTAQTSIAINGVDIIYSYQYGHVEQGHAEIICQLAANDTISFNLTSTVYGDYTSISVMLIG